MKPAQVLFLSDNALEVEAAYKAGMQVVIADRPGNAPLSEITRAAYEVVPSLWELKVTSKPAGRMMKSVETGDSSAGELSEDEAEV